MTPDRIASLRDRALEQVPGGPAKFILTLALVLGVVLSTVIAHFVTEALEGCEARKVRSPGMLARWRLRRAIRAAWSSPEFADEVARLRDRPGFDHGEYARLYAAGLDAQLGADAHAALLGLAAGLTDEDLGEAGVVL